MIVDFFIKLIIGAIDLLPTLPNVFLEGFSLIYTVFNTVNYYVPIDTVMLCISLYLLFFKFKFGINFLKWIMERVNIG